MSGMRIWHPTARSGFFTLEFRRRPLVKYNKTLKRKVPAPWHCLLCGREHTVKTIHLNVDHGGFAYVSHETWASMRKYNTAGFTVANEVTDPPQTIIGIQPGPVIPVSEIKE